MPQSAAMDPQRQTGHDSLFQSSVDGDPVIEALRGWAAFMVMATHFTYLVTPHAGLWGFASTGVDLFFVLSGFVFAPYLFGKPLYAGPHLIRRFFRLYPLYLCALLLYVVLRLPSGSAWDHVGVHLFMGHTLSSLAIANFYNPAFWSLPPEVEYYLLLPALAWAASRFRFVWPLVLATALHLLLVAAASPEEKGITARAIATVHLPGLLIEFMFGSLAYAMARGNLCLRSQRVRFFLGLLVVAGMAFMYLALIASVNGVSKTPPLWIGGNFGMGVALGYALVVSALAGPKGQPAGRLVLGLTPLFSVMGQLSYGVYLFHNAAPKLLDRILPGILGASAVLGCVGITFLLAFAAHHAIERPLRNYGRQLSRRLGAES